MDEIQALFASELGTKSLGAREAPWTEPPVCSPFEKWWLKHA